MDATMKKFVPMSQDAQDQMLKEYEMGRKGKKLDGTPKRRFPSCGENIEDNG